MTYECEVCKRMFENNAQYRGHVSGHVRRGELQKRVYKHVVKCESCDETFVDKRVLIGHVNKIHKPFDELPNDRTRKLRLILELGHKCQVCSLDSWMKEPIPIEIDHIDGNPENNLRENLRLICPNCHAQTETYKGKNMGRVQNSKRALTLKRYYGKYR